MDKTRGVAVFEGNSNSCETNSVSFSSFNCCQKYYIETREALESLQLKKLRSYM